LLKGRRGSRSPGLSDTGPPAITRGAVKGPSPGMRPRARTCVKPGDSGLAVLVGFINSLFAACTFFGDYLRSLFRYTSDEGVNSTAPPPSPANSFLPCCVPLFVKPNGGTGDRCPFRFAKPRGGKRCISWKTKNIIDSLSSIIIAALSFVSLGMVSTAPPRGVPLPPRNLKDKLRLCNDRLC
jgi:hypothetical protein